MNDPLIVTAVTVLLIVLSAFFVIVEFALLGARRNGLIPEATAEHMLAQLDERTLALERLLGGESRQAKMDAGRRAS